MHSPSPDELPPDVPAEPTEAAPVDAAPAADAAAPAPDLSPAATGARLAELFPALFVGPDGRGTWKAIKLRIHADIQARAPGQFSKRTLGIFFSRYTTTTAYLKALAVPGAQRFDLDGQPAGEIAEEHRAAAAEEVARRQAIAAERRAAQRPPRPEPRAPKPRREGTAAEGAADAADARPPRSARPLRPPRDAQPRPPRAPERQRERPPRREPRAPQAAADAAPAALPTDPAQRERALLLRSYESSPLSKSNFCALKGITEAALDAALEQARQERGARPPRG